MDNDRLALAKYRLEKSLECLNDAKTTIQSDLYNVCLNRIIYLHIPFTVFNALKNKKGRALIRILFRSWRSLTISI